MGRMTKLRQIKLVLCGPGDVAQEMKIAAKVIEDWNRLHGESRGVVIKHQHWSTDTFPDARETGQGAVNKQIIDKAELLVAIFWSRLGTATAIAASGTVEEIQRGVAEGKFVMIYFSDLESVSAHIDAKQKERLWQFRQSIRKDTSCATFQSRPQFEKIFTTHLALALNTLLRTNGARKKTVQNSPGISQVNHGSGNVQVAGDGNLINNFHQPPTIKKIIERRPGSVTPEEERQIGKWIEELAEGTVGKERSAAFKKWGAFLLARFEVEKRGSLLSSQMPDVERWFRGQKAIQIEGYKTEAAELWRNGRIGAIKAGMRQMNRTKEDYYPEISERLNMRKAFVSLTRVTKTDLTRIYRLVSRDCKARRR